MFKFLNKTMARTKTKETAKEAPKPATTETEVTVEVEPAETQISLNEALQAGGLPMNPLYMERVNNIIMDNYEKNNRVINLNGDITMEVPEMMDILRWLNFWDDESGKPVYIYISSHGGSCELGWAIIDCIENLKSHGIPVYTIVCSCAASMASLIFASGSDGCRICYPSARIMFHQCHYEMMFGVNADVARIYSKELEVTDKRMVDLLIKLTGKTRDEVRAIVDHDAYFSANEAKKLGIVNKISVLSV